MMATSCGNCPPNGTKDAERCIECPRRVISVRLTDAVFGTMPASKKLDAVMKMDEHEVTTAAVFDQFDLEAAERAKLLAKASGEQYVSQHPKPDERQAELLQWLMEECAEVQQACAKMLHFGAADIEPGQNLDNAKRLSREIGNMQALLYELRKSGITNEEQKWLGRLNKMLSITRYSQHKDNDNG